MKPCHASVLFRFCRLDDTSFRKRNLRSPMSVLLPRNRRRISSSYARNSSADLFGRPQPTTNAENRLSPPKFRELLLTVEGAAQELS